ncbi:MAG TPA: response regulator [Candidatus Saccharimonadales bacterium]|nr:response regulator [Candidatus Saccharimonadales bacterium]
MSKAKIAVIEDERSIREMYRMRFEAAGYQVYEAEDGIEGLKVIETNNPDIVLLDLRMPRLSGKEMLEKMRATDWGNSVLVIVLTNLSPTEARLDMRLLGVQQYIVKAHTTPSQVLQAVNEVLVRHNKLPRQ